MKIWIDITNTPHVNFFLPIIKFLSDDNEVFITSRDFSETNALLVKNGVDFINIGHHKGKSRVNKVLGLIFRIHKLNRTLPKFDLSLSIGGLNASPICYFRKKPSVIFSDNDTSFKYISYKLGTYFVFPLFFNSDRVIEKFSVSSEKIYKYGGYKEDIYIAQYEPNPNFLDGMPFDNFITIRPENLKASYVPKNAKTIVPELFDLFRNENILYLPRYSYEKKYADGYSNIYIPSGPLNGLDVCYYTKAMLTGAGSFAREAAIMGKPSISFFPGKTWLSVDKAMQDNGWEYASRNPLDIYNYVNSGKIERGIRHNSKKTFDEVVEILNNIIRKHNK